MTISEFKFNPPQVFDLKLEQIRIQIYVGLEEVELQAQQAVDVKIHMRFAEPPPGCLTDKLSDTSCYKAIVEKIEDYCQGKAFKLIERLGYELFFVVKEHLAHESSRAPELWLQVTKVQPPLAALRQGSTFAVGDFRP